MPASWHRDQGPQACAPDPVTTDDVKGVFTMATITHTAPRTAVLDDAHVGDIRGALGTIPADDFAPRVGLSAKLKTLLAIVGPGLIVMCGDNDAGAFSTYGQAGQTTAPGCCGPCCCWFPCCT